MYDAYGKPLGPSEYPHPGYPMAPQYPGMPPQYPMMQAGPYAPHMMDPAYSQGKSHLHTMLFSEPRNSRNPPFEMPGGTWEMD